MEEEEDKKPAAVQRVEPTEISQLGQEESDSLLLEDILLAQEERNGQLAIDEVTILAVNCVESDAIRGNMLQPHGIVPEGEAHQMVGEGTVNVGLKWNHKEMGVFLPASPNHSAVKLMKELTAFFKNNKKEVILKFDTLCDNRDNSDLTGIRYINGGRYELFLGAKGKSNAAIEWAMVKAAKENELPKTVHLLTE